MLKTLYEARHRPPQPYLIKNQTHGDTILYLGAPDIEAMFQYLISQGVEVSPSVVQAYVMKQIHLKDPDGYGVCFQWRVG